MSPGPEKQAGKLLSLLAEDGKEYGSLVAERLVKLVRSEPLETRDALHRRLVVGAAPYLSHTAWYARVAAASCLESLARLECGETTREISGGERGKIVAEKLARGWVSLEDVRLQQVLGRGVLLLSRGVQQDIAIQSEAASLDVDARVGRQRKRLLKCLGLAGGGSGDARAASLYSSLGDVIDDEDLAGPRSTHNAAEKKCVDDGSNYPNSDANKMTLSARQRNRLARHRRSTGFGSGGGGTTMSSGGKRRRQEGTPGGADSTDGDNSKERGSGGGSGLGSRGDLGAAAFLGPGGGIMEVATDARGALVSLAADLVTQASLRSGACLFHPVWQCRHGAALGALSILRAWNARRRRGEPVPYGDRMEAWAEDAVARCVCVLALDQFGDYSGRMVAPVRETAAQLLAVAALQLRPDRLEQTATLLCELTMAEEWQARHGGFCGLESLCAVAIRGDQGEGGERHHGQGRGGEEDVCAAAARAARLVTKRFLPLSWRVGGTVMDADELSSRRTHGGETGCTAAAGHSEQHSTGRRRERGAEGGAAESSGGGGDAGVEERVEENEKEIFHLVWKALGALHQDSACVEDIADLLEICCDDAASRSRRRRSGGGAVDPLTDEGGDRLQRLLELWGDGRARVRASAVRSLSALAGVTIADATPTSKEIAGDTSWAINVNGLGARLLRRCFRGILFETDDGVREQTAQLWKALLPGMQR
ncbi:unnamed protein product [Sphacelaria rigidula]